jgi:hypothetical protein
MFKNGVYITDHKAGDGHLVEHGQCQSSRRNGLRAREEWRLGSRLT